MDITDLYQSKRTTPKDAVAAIPSGSKLSMGMAMTEPPALLGALAVGPPLGWSAISNCIILRPPPSRATRCCATSWSTVRPYCMFVAAVDRALINAALANDGRKVLNFVPNNFHETPRLLSDEIGIDVFLVTVSPMDRHGYFEFRPR